MAAGDPVIVGNALSNLVEDPESPEVYRESYDGSSEVGQVTRSYTVIKTGVISTVPTYGTPDTLYTGCFMRRIRTVSSGDGLTSKVKLEYFTQSGPNVSFVMPGETVLELEQTFIQAPVWEGYGYVNAGLTMATIQQVKYLVENAHWDSSNDWTDTGTQVTMKWISPLDGSIKTTVITGTQKAYTLFKDLIQGREFYQQPSAILHVSTTMQPSLTTLGGILKTRGLLKHPGYGLPGTNNNWLYLSPRAYRRRASGQTFTEFAESWQYNPNGWERNYSAPMYYDVT